MFKYSYNVLCSQHAFLKYFRRLRRLYELDLQILDQTITLLEEVREEVLPQLANVLEPLLNTLTLNVLDLGQILQYAAQTIQSSTFHFGATTSLERLKFLNIGK